MLEFLIIIAIIQILSKITVGERVIDEPAPPFNPYDNGKPEQEAMSKAWEFDNIDDVMEFRELRRSGWRGNAEDFYKLREKGEI